MYVGFADIQCQILLFHTDSKCRTKILVALPPLLLREVVVKQGFTLAWTNIQIRGYVTNTNQRFSKNFQHMEVSRQKHACFMEGATLSFVNQCLWF